MGWTRRSLLCALPVGIGAGLAGCNTGDSNDGASNTTERPTATATRNRPISERATSTVGMDESTTETHEPTTDTRGTPTPAGARLTTDRSGTVTTSEPKTPTRTNEQAAHTVGMFTGLYFDPVGLHVEPGTTVAFENVSGAHSATAFHPAVETYSIAPERRVPMDARPWNTGVIYEVGKSKAVTFETEGTYDYFCIPHVQAGMVGRIVVGDPGGPATETQNPYATYYPLPDSERIVTEGEVPFEAVAPE